MQKKRNHPKIQVFLLVAIALGVACSGSPDSSVHLPIAPEFNFTNGSATPGPVVLRTDNHLFTVTSDPKTGLVAVLGLPESLRSTFCGGSDDLQSVDAQLLFLPNGAIASLINGEDRSVVVYDRPSFLSYLPDICAATIEGTIVARGTASVVSTDNDITGFGGPGINTWGFNAHGVVEDETTGELLSFHTVSRYQLKNDGTLRVLVSKVTLGD